MTRRLTITWPDPAPFLPRDQRPIRILAASDEDDPALDYASNRDALGHVDLVVGAGDLSPERLAFLGDAFRASMVVVRGNHDRGGPWPQPDQVPLPASGVDMSSLPGIPILALPWPTSLKGPSVRDDGAAWRQVLRAANLRLVRRGDRPWLVVSHVPPRDVGDTPSDPYHVGFSAYRAALDRLRPPLWLHGHTSRAASPVWQVAHGPSTVVNVTGSVLVELLPAPVAHGESSLGE